MALLPLRRGRYARIRRDEFSQSQYEAFWEMLNQSRDAMAECLHLASDEYIQDSERHELVVSLMYLDEIISRRL